MGTKKSRMDNKRPLYICCYGSSSKQTPDELLVVSRQLGRQIGSRGRKCVTGGGQYGCMSGVQSGCVESGSTNIYVVHQKFIDGGTVDEKAHGVEKVLVAKGDNLEERKKLLMENADALIVMPGGVGTFDEFWDCVSHRSLAMKGLCSKPIVVLNHDGFYDGFVA